MEKIMIAAPTSDVKKYIQNKWLDHINQFTYDDITLVIIDNSPTNKNKNDIIQHLKEIKFRYPYYIQHRKPQKQLRETLLECSNVLRNYFLTGDFTHFMSLETDIIIQPGHIEHLIALDKYVVCLPYFHGKKENPFILNSTITEINGVKMSSKQTAIENFLFIDGTVKPAFQCGIGCMMIKREIIECIPFRLGHASFDIGFPDCYFHDDLARHGIPVWMDTSIIVEHFNDYERWDKIRNKP